MPQSWESYIANQELPEECPVCGGEWQDNNGNLLVPKNQIPFCSPTCKDKYERGDKPMRKNVKPVHVDFDSAYSASNHTGDYTVYFAVERRPDGWWLGVAVDGGHFTETTEPADGPYPTEDEAIMGGENAVWEIMGHQFRHIYWDDRLKRIHRQRGQRRR